MEHQYPFQTIPLSYGYIAFSPYADPNTMYLHHNQYYQTKVKELNRLVLQHQMTDRTIQDILTQKLELPTNHLNRLRDTAGAVFNHELFFDELQGHRGTPPLNRLVGVLTAIYGSMKKFQSLILEAAESLPGVGWVWLVSERSGGPHLVITQSNEVVALDIVQPLLILDMWEHAYLLDDQFDKESYIDGWFSFIDWDKANKRFENSCFLY